MDTDDDDDAYADNAYAAAYDDDDDDDEYQEGSGDAGNHENAREKTRFHFPVSRFFKVDPTIGRGIHAA